MRPCCSHSIIGPGSCLQAQPGPELSLLLLKATLLHPGRCIMAVELPAIICLRCSNLLHQTKYERALAWPKPRTRPMQECFHNYGKRGTKLGCRGCCFCGRSAVELRYKCPNMQGTMSDAVGWQGAVLVVYIASIPVRQNWRSRLKPEILCQPACSCQGGLLQC